MFGYILANLEQLTQEEKLRYRSCYCGLCHAIGARASGLCRLSLNYDMTFLVVLLSALYEPDEQSGLRRCVMHPVKSHGYWISDATNYCADMNVALSYYNCIDDWHDDHDLLKLSEAQLFKRASKRISGEYPRQAEAITRCLGELSQLERGNVLHPDAAANCFGRLMGELFVWKETDFWSPALRRTGEALGRFIYIMDAVCDLESDLRHHHYNPLAAPDLPDTSPDAFSDHLTLLIGDVAAEFEKLPLVQDAALLRNILYTGVWTKYLLAVKRREKQKNKGEQL